MRAPSPALIEGAGFGCALASPRSATAATDLEAARTSVSVTRPSGQVPFTFARSTPSSAAIRRATGDAFTRPSSAVFSSRATARVPPLALAAAQSLFLSLSRARAFPFRLLLFLVLRVSSLLSLAALLFL